MMRIYTLASDWRKFVPERIYAILLLVCQALNMEIFQLQVIRYKIFNFFLFIYCTNMYLYNGSHKGDSRGKN